MDLSIEHIKENHPEQWRTLEKVWRVVDGDYELRKKRDEFLGYLEREHNEGLKAIAEWSAYLRQEQQSMT